MKTRLVSLGPRVAVNYNNPRSRMILTVTSINIYRRLTKSQIFMRYCHGLKPSWCVFCLEGDVFVFTNARKTLKHLFRLKYWHKLLLILNRVSFLFFSSFNSCCFYRVVVGDGGVVNALFVVFVVCFVVAVVVLISVFLLKKKQNRNSIYFPSKRLSQKYRDLSFKIMVARLKFSFNAMPSVVLWICKLLSGGARHSSLKKGCPSSFFLFFFLAQWHIDLRGLFNTKALLLEKL